MKLISLEEKMCWNVLKVPFKKKKKEMEPSKDSVRCQMAEV